MSHDYDLPLFAELNDEFRAKPLIAERIRSDPKTHQDRARSRIRLMRRELKASFRDKVVLEVGCGNGWMTAYLPELGGAARAIGLDVSKYPAWDQHDDPRVELKVADLATEDVVPAESVDFVVSVAVLEHVEHPLEMLDAIHRVLVPGGRAWLRFNVYRGPKASHRYNEVHFPWPHLLFDDEVCEAYYAGQQRKTMRFSWVNRMTVAHYLQACHDLGFGIHTVERQTTPIDIEFYLRFRDKLSRYPALDLETDFLTLMLEKGDGPWPMPSAGYLERQRAFEAQLAAALAERAEATATPTPES